MAQYLRIVRKGKQHTRIELLDHSTIQIPTEQLSEWDLLPEEERPVIPVNPNPQKRYIKVIRKCKNNIRVQLPDYTTLLIPSSEFSDWEQVEASSDYVNEHINENEVENMDAEIAEVFHSTSDSTNNNESSITENESVNESITDNDSEQGVTFKLNVVDDLIEDAYIPPVPENKLVFEEIRDAEVDEDMYEKLPLGNLAITPLDVELVTIKNKDKRDIPKEDVSKSDVSKSDNRPKYKIAYGYYLNSKAGWVAWVHVLTNDLSHFWIPCRVSVDKVKELSALTENKINLLDKDIEEIQSFFDLSIRNADYEEKNTREPLILTPPVEEPKKRRGKHKKNIEPLTTNVSIPSTELNISNDSGREVIRLSSPDIIELNDSVEDTLTENKNNKEDSSNEDIISLSVEETDNVKTEEVEEDSIIILEDVNKNEDPNESEKDIVLEDVTEDLFDFTEKSPSTIGGVEENVEENSNPVQEPVVEETKKRRGRPKRSQVLESLTTDSTATAPVEEAPKKKRGRKPKAEREDAPRKTHSFRRNTNGLGLDHPYESVDMDYETVEYDDDITAPF